VSPILKAERRSERKEVTQPTRRRGRPVS
jgi:hypothetical protein